MHKTKALLLNFISYAILFFGFRYLGIAFAFSSSLTAAFVAAVLAMVLSPKFASVETDNGRKLFVKIPFIKELKQFP